jgi:hypothetical protein
MGHGSGGDLFFLDAAEHAVIDRGLSVIGKTMPDQRILLEAALARLRRTAELIRDFPSLKSSWNALADRAFSADSLVEVLCQVPDYDLDLHIPTKAVVGQAYLIAKINFLKALGYTLSAVSAPTDLQKNIESEIGQSIYTKLAEELFVSIVTDPTALSQVKSGAARFLFRIWEERLLIEVDDFAPVLESAWQARSKVLPVLGTMLGTHEVFRLFKEARDHRFLDYFGGEDVQEEQLLAFEEFLFGLSHEEIARLRSHMTSEGRSCVSLDDAREVLGESATKSTAPQGGAQALYTSYKKRRVNAAFRQLTNASGPKKTAEEYVLTSFLQAGASPSTFSMKAAREAR